jgi:hypothetical protein
MKFNEIYCQLNDEYHKKKKKMFHHLVLIYSKLFFNCLTLRINLKHSKINFGEKN